MPSSFRDPKTLADWIQLDYFRKPGRVWTVRNLLTWLVLITCLALITFSLAPGARFVYESRPVSSAHAMFNDNCSVCHAASFQPALRLLQADSSVRSVPKEACRACHNGSPHHGHDPNCSTCHQEHRGRAVLARVADNQCTACHADLNAVGGSPGGFAASIHEFARDHPAFGAWRQGLLEHGTIRFNHKVHLTLTRERVRGLDHPLIALPEEQRCTYCHRLDEKPDAAGRYMKPVNYDQHCSQCHVLSVGVTGNGGDEKLRAAGARFAQKPAPHKDPETVRAALRERFTRFVEDNPAVLRAQETTEPPRWVPVPSQVQAVADKEWLWVNEQLQRAERMIFYGANGCSYCHKLDAVRGPGNLPHYLPSNIPSVWFPHSVFSHERHRMLRCTECHAQAAKDMLLPAIKDCRQCHSSQVGARTDCAECHRYHDRSNEGFQGQKSILDCLRRE